MTQAPDTCYGNHIAGGVPVDYDWSAHDAEAAAWFAEDDMIRGMDDTEYYEWYSRQTWGRP